MSYTPKDAQRAEELAARVDNAMNEQSQIEDTFGSDRSKWPAGQRERHDRMAETARKAARELEDLATREQRMEKLRDIARSGGANVESGTPFADLAAYEAGTSRTRGPWAGLDETSVRTETPAGWAQRAHDVLGVARGLHDEGRNSLARMIDEEGGLAAAFVVATSAPAYRSAFEKVFRNPERGILTLDNEERAAFAAVESVRASMSTNVGTAGYTVPLALQPGLTIANNGTANPFRRIAQVDTTISSPARLVKSTGITAEWKTELAAASDASPTFTKVDVSLFAASAFVGASYEIIGDGPGSIEALPALLADARDRLEADAFATGNGTSAPAGIVTRVGAVTASRVSPTTGGAFGVQADVYKPWDALPARARQSAKLAWIANNAIISKIRQFDTAGGSAFWADLGSATPPTLLGAPIYEASSMASSLTTGSDVLLAGDFSKYRIFDHIAGTTLVYIPALFDQATGRPNGSAGWHMFGRTGADCADETQFRLLRL